MLRLASGTASLSRELKRIQNAGLEMRRFLSMNDESASVCRERRWEVVSADPSVFAGLVAVAALRNPATGQYEQPLAAIFGAAQVDATLAQIHREIFECWLGLKLEEQERDLSGMLRRLHREDEPAALLRRIAPGVERLLPARCGEAERRLFESDFDVLSALID